MKWECNVVHGCGKMFSRISEQYVWHVIDEDVFHLLSLPMNNVRLPISLKHRGMVVLSFSDSLPVGKKPCHNR